MLALRSHLQALQGKALRNDVLITGTIKEDHTIGRIGVPRARALAAKKNGAVIFLVPRPEKRSR